MFTLHIEINILVVDIVWVRKIVWKDKWILTEIEVLNEFKMRQQNNKNVKC